MAFFESQIIQKLQKLKVNICPCCRVKKPGLNGFCKDSVLATETISKNGGYQLKTFFKLKKFPPRVVKKGIFKYIESVDKISKSILVHRFGFDASICMF